MPNWEEVDAELLAFIERRRLEEEEARQKQLAEVDAEWERESDLLEVMTADVSPDLRTEVFDDHTGLDADGEPLAWEENFLVVDRSGVLSPSRRDGWRHGSKYPEQFRVRGGPDDTPRFSDPEEVGRLVGVLLGSDIDDVRRVYKSRKLSNADRELRARLDDRLLELSRQARPRTDDLTVTDVARVVGFYERPNVGSGGTTFPGLLAALKRARAAEQ